MKVYTVKIEVKHLGTKGSYVLGVYNELDPLIRDLKLDMEAESCINQEAIAYIRENWGHCHDMGCGDENYFIQIEQFYLNGD
jgi:hypothetical protein